MFSMYNKYFALDDCSFHFFFLHFDLLFYISHVREDCIVRYIVEIADAV